MTEYARVDSVTRTAMHDADRTPLDIIRLHWQRKVYYWSTAPGVYTAGDQVEIVPPTATGMCIAPADPDIRLDYSGVVTGQPAQP